MSIYKKFPHLDFYIEWLPIYDEVVSFPTGQGLLWYLLLFLFYHNFLLKNLIFPLLLQEFFPSFSIMQNFFISADFIWELKFISISLNLSCCISHALITLFLISSQFSSFFYSKRNFAGKLLSSIWISILSRRGPEIFSVFVRPHLTTFFFPLKGEGKCTVFIEDSCLK